MTTSNSNNFCSYERILDLAMLKKQKVAFDKCSEAIQHPQETYFKSQQVQQFSASYDNVVTSFAFDKPISPKPAISNAPKFGRVIPNRIFVGGLDSKSTEEDLEKLFSYYGAINQTKIVRDRAEVSKCFGFVTFENVEDAANLRSSGKDIFLHGKKLNVGAAIEKARTNLPKGEEIAGLMKRKDVHLLSSPGDIVYHAGGYVSYTDQNDVTYFSPALHLLPSVIAQQQQMLSVENPANICSGLIKPLPGPAGAFPVYASNDGQQQSNSLQLSLSQPPNALHLYESNHMCNNTSLSQVKAPSLQPPPIYSFLLCPPNDKQALCAEEALQPPSVAPARLASMPVTGPAFQPPAQIPGTMVCPRTGYFSPQVAYLPMVNYPTSNRQFHPIPVAMTPPHIQPISSPSMLPPAQSPCSPMGPLICQPMREMLVCPKSISAPPRFIYPPMLPPPGPMHCSSPIPPAMMGQGIPHQLSTPPLVPPMSTNSPAPSPGLPAQPFYNQVPVPPPPMSELPRAAPLIPPYSAPLQYYTDQNLLTPPMTPSVHDQM